MDSAPLWSTLDRVSPKAPRRYIVLIHEAGNFQFQASKVEKVSALSRFFDLILTLTDANKGDLATWQFKGIGKDIKTLEHNFSVSCEAWPVCLEIILTCHCSLGGLKWRASVISRPPDPARSSIIRTISPRSSIANPDGVTSQRGSAPGPSVSPRLMSNAPWSVDATVFLPFVLACYQWLEESASSLDSLLRTPDREEMTLIAELRKKADPSEIRACRNTNVVCGVLRIWLRNLAEPPVPVAVYDLIREVSAITEQKLKLDGMRRLLSILSPANRAILFRTCELLRYFDRRGLQPTLHAALALVPYMLRSPRTNDVTVLRQTSQALGDLLVFTATHGALLFAMERSNSPPPAENAALRSSFKKAALMLGLEQVEKLSESEKLRQRLSEFEAELALDFASMPVISPPPVSGTGSLPHPSSAPRPFVFRPMSVTGAPALAMQRNSTDSSGSPSSSSSSRPSSAAATPQSPTGSWIRSTSPQKDASPLASRWRNSRPVSPRTHSHSNSPAMGSPNVSPRSSISRSPSSPSSASVTSSPIVGSHSSSAIVLPPFARPASPGQTDAPPAALTELQLPPAQPAEAVPPLYHGSMRRAPSPTHSASLTPTPTPPPPADLFRVKAEDEAAMNTIVSMLENGNLDEVQAYLEELSMEEKQDIGPRLTSELHRRLSQVEAYVPEGR